MATHRDERDFEWLWKIYIELVFEGIRIAPYRDAFSRSALSDSKQHRSMQTILSGW
jgi:hypothetical protein